MSGIVLLYGLLGHTLGLLPVELSLYFEIVINKYNSSVSFFYLVSPYYDRELFYDTEKKDEITRKSFYKWQWLQVRLHDWLFL